MDSWPSLQEARASGAQRRKPSTANHSTTSGAPLGGRSVETKSATASTTSIVPQSSHARPPTALLQPEHAALRQTGGGDRPEAVAPPSSQELQPRLHPPQHPHYFAPDHFNLAQYPPLSGVPHPIPPPASQFGVSSAWSPEAERSGFAQTSLPPQPRHGHPSLSTPHHAFYAPSQTQDRPQPPLYLHAHAHPGTALPGSIAGPAHPLGPPEAHLDRSDLPRQAPSESIQRAHLEQPPASERVLPPTTFEGGPPLPPVMPPPLAMHPPPYPFMPYPNPIISFPAPHAPLPLQVAGLHFVEGTSPYQLPPPRRDFDSTRAADAARFGANGSVSGSSPSVGTSAQPTSSPSLTSGSSVLPASPLTKADTAYSTASTPVETTATTRSKTPTGPRGSEWHSLGPRGSEQHSPQHSRLSHVSPLRASLNGPAPTYHVDRAGGAGARDLHPAPSISRPLQPPRPVPVRHAQQARHLSKYAAPFVPAWLRGVNEEAASVHVALPPGEGIDYAAYARAFVPRELWDEMEAERLRASGNFGQDGAATQAELGWSEPEDEEDLEESDPRRVDDELGEAGPTAASRANGLQAVASAWLGPGGEALDGELEPEPESVIRDGESAVEINGLHQPKSTDVGSERARRRATLSSSGDPSANPVAGGEGHRTDGASLEPRSYGHRFEELLSMERDHRAALLQSQAQYAAALHVHPTPNQRGGTKRGGTQRVPAWSRSGLYVLHLPGIREDFPPLQPGDLVHLRPLATTAVFLSQDGGAEDAHEAANGRPGGASSLQWQASGGWLHVVLEARVWALRRVEGSVILRCPQLEEQLKGYYPGVPAARFNVLFQGVEREVRVALAAARTAARLLHSEGRRGTALRRWLFPTQGERDPMSTALSKGPNVQDLERSVWFDRGLNEEQKIAAYTLATRSHSIPYLIAGPPGTGKTKTVVESVLQILRHSATRVSVGKDGARSRAWGGRARVLLCAPSNTAADTLALRLASHLSPKDMVRLNDPTRTFAEVPDALLPYCHTRMDDDEAGESGGASSFTLPPWRMLMHAKVVVTATFDVGMLHRARCTNHALGRVWQALSPLLASDEEEVDGGTWGANRTAGRRDDAAPPARRRPRAPLHFTHLLIDEAAQGTEADLLAAILCVLPHGSTLARSGGRLGGGGDAAPDEGPTLPTIALVGDTAQLGPHVLSAEARSGGLDLSLLDRLSEREPYAAQLRRLRREAKSTLLRAQLSARRRDDAMDENAGERPEAEAAAMAAGAVSLPGDIVAEQLRSGCCMHLVRNYRARTPHLLHCASTLFYEDCLLPCAIPPSQQRPLQAAAADAPSLSLLPNPSVPMLFVDVAEGRDEWVDEGASFYNEAEIASVVRLCARLVGVALEGENGQGANAGLGGVAAARPGGGWHEAPVGPVRAEDVAVITPYREQVWRIRLALRRHGLARVSVGNCEAFQGAEHLVTVVSTVRARRRFLAADASRGMGLIFERRRLCVTLTRAKEALFIVGNARCLSLDPYWREVLLHARRHGYYVRSGAGAGGPRRPSTTFGRGPAGEGRRGPDAITPSHGALDHEGNRGDGADNLDRTGEDDEEAEEGDDEDDEDDDVTWCIERLEEDNDGMARISALEAADAAHRSATSPSPAGGISRRGEDLNGDAQSGVASQAAAAAASMLAGRVAALALDE